MGLTKVTYAMIEGAPANVLDFGAVGDGVTDNLTAFNAAVANGVYPIYIPDGTYYLSAQPNTNKDVFFELSSEAVVNVSGGFFPRQYLTTSSYAPYGKKINFSSMQPVKPAGYYVYPQAPQTRLDLINQWGEHNIATGSRTQAAQNWWSGLHSAKGDCYNFYGSIAAQPWSGASSVTDWGDRNSTGLGNGQVSALDDNVNLYGIGDINITDNGNDNVAMFGNVLLLSRNGTDTVAYGVPRVGYLISSIGANPIDAGYSHTGPSYVGYDASGGSFTSNVAFALSSTQKIAWNATPPNTALGKFSTQSVGTTTTGWNGSYLQTDVNGVEVLGLHQTFVDTVVDLNPRTDATLDLGSSALRWDNSYSKNIRPGAGNVLWTSGSGSPEGAVTAVVGSLYTRTDGGTGTTLYVKETGTGNTGWAAK